MKEILRPDNLFVDELDGKWTLGFTDKNGGTESIGFFDEEDAWLYPHELGFDHVINVFRDNSYLGEDNEIAFNDNKEWHFNVYDLPKNWMSVVTQNSGKDGKPSIHDIMIGVY